MDYIQNRQALMQLGEKLSGQSWVALDTEFMRESTYYAELCLIQVASEDTLACIDPLSVDIDPLLEILYQPEMLKIFHAGRQDLELFFDLRKTIPHPVFDTQIAAAFLGYADQIGYADLVHRLLDKKLDKAHTRTNWSKRPLSQGQIRYALDDVHYLYPLYQALYEQLESAGRLPWVEEESRRLTDISTYANNPQLAYLRFKQTGKLSAQQMALLQRLAAWRETTAQKRNRPRGWILSNKAIMDICFNQPQTSEDLLSLSSLNPKTVDRWGKSILECMNENPATGSSDIIMDTPLNKSQANTCKAIQKLVTQESEKLQISSTVLASKKDIKAFLLGEENNILAQGWRHELLGESLQSLMSRQ